MREGQKMKIRRKQKIAILGIAILASILMINLPVFADSFTTWISMSSDTQKDLNGVWGAESDEVFAVGNLGTITYFDGSNWDDMKSGTTNDLNGIWGDDDDDVHAVGNSGTILHYDGSDWSAESSGAANDLNGIWGSDDDDVYAVGSAGTILHYDGSDWSALSSVTANDLNGIWGNDNDNIYAVGNSGTILHYDGADWSTVSSGTTSDLQCIWGAYDADIFAAGNSGTVVYYDGSDWNLMDSDTTSDLYGIWGADDSNIFVAGESGAIEYYDGSGFEAMNRNTNNKLQAVWGFSSIDVFTAGNSGTILRYMPPMIDSISEDQGDQGDTLSIIIEGTNLAETTEVRFGTGIAVNDFTVIDESQVEVIITIVAGAETGTRDVKITTEGGSFTLSDCFTVNQSLPTITGVSPDQDIQGVTQNVTLTGTSLAGVSEVQFGAGIAVNSFSILSSKQVSVNITIAADAKTGARDISISTTGGSFTLPEGFIVNQALPAITSISPAQGNQAITLNVTIEGANFTGASAIQLGTGITVNSFTVLNATQISANISIAAGIATGTRDVSVTTPGGSITLSDSFTVKQALPAITSISPDTGSQGATQNVTINGANFTGTSEVRLGTGVVVNSFTVLSDSQISASVSIVSSTETGYRDVTVTTPGGSSVLSYGFTVKQGLPVISSISPSQGSRGSTLTVIISGSNLNGATAVSLGAGAIVQSFVNLSPTQISVNVLIDEKAVTGVRDVSVTTPGGSSTLSNSFDIIEKSLSILLLALIWIGIAVIIVIFVVVLNALKKKRTNKV